MLRLVRLTEAECYKYNATDMFAAYDYASNKLGTCAVIPYVARELLRDCPMNTYLKLDTELSALPELYGAGLAATIERHKGYTEDVRIYTSCPAVDIDRLKALVGMGLRNDDAAFSMENELKVGPIIGTPPGLSWLCDRLEYEDDRRQCLRMINAVFIVPHQPEWLEELRVKNAFRRIAAVSPNGVVGELLLHVEDGIGVIDMLVVNKPSRRNGVGSFLLDAARIALLNEGAKRARADVWQRLKPAMALFEARGYHSYTPTTYFPGTMILALDKRNGIAMGQSGSVEPGVTGARDGFELKYMARNYRESP